MPPTHAVASCQSATSATAPTSASPTARRFEISLEEGVSEAWGEAARALPARFAGRTDLDEAARLEIFRASEGAIVHVALTDGRSAVRRVASPDDLALTVEMLLLRPVARAPTRPASALAPESSTEGAAATSRPDAATPPAARTAFEVGLGPSAHLTFRPVYFGYGMAAHAQIAARDWLVGAALRWDIDDLGTGQSLPPGFNMQAVHVSMLVGRRFHSGGADGGNGGWAFDVTLGPGIAVENQEADRVGPSGIGATRSEVVVTGGVRLSRPVGTVFRWYLAPMLDVLPSRLRSERRVDPGLPPLPPWGLGLSVGAAWEDR